MRINIKRYIKWFIKGDSWKFDFEHCAEQESSYSGTKFELGVKLLKEICGVFERSKVNCHD